MKFTILISFFGIITISLLTINVSGQSKTPVLVEYNEIMSGAERTSLYLELLKNKNIAIVANQSSLIGDTHLVDSLYTLGVNIVKIFCPEHGFRGNEDAGKYFEDDVDKKTGIPIVSLYGSNRKPLDSDLSDVNIVLFDLQDVGTRFYTYISTMTYVMEACAENEIPIIILDRPNPNGFYVDGPVLDSNYKSFVGLHPVPVVYGMTIGEYAKMVEGEGWINKSNDLDMQVIECEDYERNMIVKLKVKPSPNLPTWQSVYLYPSLCLFEGTIMSVGRGTSTPFQVFGHPDFFVGSFIFTPDSTEGATNPKYKGKHCYGSNITGFANNYSRNTDPFNLNYLIGAYEIMNQSHEFFNSYFNTLAGNDKLKKQITDGLTDNEIKASWKENLDKFLLIREKYLIYD